MVPGIKRLAGKLSVCFVGGRNYSTCGSELSEYNGFSLSCRTFPTLIDKPSEQTELIDQIISTTAINAQELRPR